MRICSNHSRNRLIYYQNWKVYPHHLRLVWQCYTSQGQSAGKVDIDHQLSACIDLQQLNNYSVADPSQSRYREWSRRNRDSLLYSVGMILVVFAIPSHKHVALDSKTPENKRTPPNKRRRHPSSLSWSLLCRQSIMQLYTHN